MLETMFYKFFGKTNDGFFVDLGAYNPLKYSNTMKFYVKGWRGVNIDARPGSMKEFNKLRPEDINVEAAISPDGKQAVYYEFSEPTANTFDSRAAEESLKLGLTMTGKHVLDTYTVNELFEKYIPEGQKIDLLDIDVEGFDSMIVQQLDWDKYHPSIVMIETSVDSDNIIPEIMEKMATSLEGVHILTIFIYLGDFNIMSGNGRKKFVSNTAWVIAQHIFSLDHIDYRGCTYRKVPWSDRLRKD